MFQCRVCGGAVAENSFISEVFTIENRHVLVERIPAQVCKRCGEPTFSRETTEEIRRLIHNNERPIRTVPLEVLALG